MHAMGVLGGICARPEIRVKVSYAPVIVHMASELTPSSCAYNAIFGHEMKHVDAYQRQLTLTKAALERSLDERFRDRKAMRYANIDAAEKDFDAIQNDWLNPRALHLLEGVAALQDDIDSPAEYERLDASCGGMRDLMRKP